MILILILFKLLAIFSFLLYFLLRSLSMCIWIETFNLLDYWWWRIIVSLATIFQQVPCTDWVIWKTRNDDLLCVLNCALLLNIRTLNLTSVRKGRRLSFILLRKNHHPLILYLRGWSYLGSVLSESRLKSVGL